MIHIGTEIHTPVTHPETEIWCEEPLLRPHLHTPWLNAYLAERLGTPLATANSRQEVVTADNPLLDRHILAVGSSGSGKSRICEHLLAEQIRSGCSAVIIDPKPDTITRLLRRFQLLGLDPRQLTLLIPRCKAAPGWNLFAGEITPEQAVTALVSMLSKSTTSWGPRMADLLTNAGLVIAGLQLSLLELMRFLVQEEYRDVLLTKTPKALDPFTFEEVRDYFQNEFSRWSRSERIQAVAPITNKLREFLRSSFLRSLTCARYTTLKLSRLWHEQHIVLVHLDEAILGSESTRLLAGMLAHALFHTSMRTTGPRKVVFCLDELASLERFMGSSLIDIVTMARSRNLRLMVACQYISGLSDNLSAALLANTAVQLVFRVGIADSRQIASSFATTSEQTIRRVTLTAEPVRRNDPPALAEWEHPIYDVCGRPLRASQSTWHFFSIHTSHDPIAALQSLGRQAGKGRLYVKSADTGEPVELGRYTQGVSPTALHIIGPTPLRLVVSFPRQKITAIERSSESEQAREWGRILLGLPVQTCAVRLAGAPSRVVRVVDVPTPPATAQQTAFVRAALAANCQSPTAIREGLVWRVREVARLSGHTHTEGGSDDGSLS